MSSSTTNNNNGSAATTPSGGPPPLPATKPVLGSTGSYTAGIHSVNKQHSVVVGEKPVIAARPIPPPTLPKYTSSFGKFDRAEREKDGIGGSYRLPSLDRLAYKQRLLQENGGLGLVERNGNGLADTAAQKSTTTTTSAAAQPSTTHISSVTTALLQSKREMFFKSEGQANSINNNNNNLTTPATNNGLNHHHVTTNNNHTSSTTITQITTSSTNNSTDKPDGVVTSSSSGGGVGLKGVGPAAAPPAVPVNPPTNGHTTTTATNGSSINNNHSVNNLTSNLATMSVKAGVVTASAAAPPAVPKMDSSHMSNGNGHHVDSNKMDRHVEKMDHEKYQHPVVRAKPKELDGYVGFANLPNQVYRKAVKRGFDFTLMVVGESGLGKSTLINSMFLSEIYNNDQHPGPSLRAKKTVGVDTTKVLLKENSVNLSLTIVDTPGFGDAVDNSNCWVPVIDFIENKYEEYLTAESRVQRKAITDSRVHCCLYFIAPSGHGLKPLDVEFMQRLCDKVNIIPVIAKADTMTPEEVALFKKQILNEIAQHKIKIYDFPEPLENEEEAKALRQLRQRVPFAVVGANTVIEVDGKKVRGRRYPWGVAEVENLDHCDFIALRNMVIRTHLHDLKDVTNHVHYENYRCRKLAGLGNDGKGRLSNKNPLAQMEEEKKEHELKMKKMEAEMEQVFEMKVKEKKQKLKDSEVEMSRRHDERKKQLEGQVRELDERRRAFEQEKKDWEEHNGVTLDELKRRSLEANSKENTDESKSRRGFGSLLRRHTSFNAPEANGGGGGSHGGSKNGHGAAPLMTSPQDFHEY